MKIAFLGLALAVTAAAVLFGGCAVDVGVGPDVDVVQGAALGPCTPTAANPECGGGGLYPACDVVPDTIFRCPGKDRRGLSVLWCYSSRPVTWTDVAGQTQSTASSIAGCSTPPAPGEAAMNCGWGCP